MKHKVRGAKPHDDSLNPEQRLLDELYRQRTELGEIAAELISLLEAAGVSSTSGPDSRSGRKTAPAFPALPPSMAVVDSPPE